MQRKSFDECKTAYMLARGNRDWRTLMYWADEMLHYNDTLPWVWANRGNALQGLGHPRDAILNYEKAIRYEVNPEHKAGVLNNVAGAYWEMWDDKRAVEYAYKSIELHPYAETYMLLGHIRKYFGENKDAIKYYRKGIEINPQQADCHMGLGMMLLKDGQLKEGWQEYEWRWKTDQLPERKMRTPRWNGEDLDNKTILVYGEQGLGDIIQFARYVRILSQRYVKLKIIVEGRPQVQRLLDTIPEAYAVISGGEKLPEVDYAIPMISLAGMLTPSLEHIPASRNEYFIKHRDVERWKNKLNATQIPGKRIGICWAGMSRPEQVMAAVIDSLRSLELSAFAPLAKIPGIFWISFQKGPPAIQVSQPSSMLIGDFTEEMYDFYETCAAMSACDLIITVDTAVAHAAASIGKPTWLLSRWDGCWRWFGDREDSPWYPTLRQFVQKQPREWTGVIEEMAKELERFLKQ